MNCIGPLSQGMAINAENFFLGWAETMHLNLGRIKLTKE